MENKRGKDSPCSKYAELFEDEENLDIFTFDDFIRDIINESNSGFYNWLQVTIHVPIS